MATTAPIKVISVSCVTGSDVDSDRLDEDVAAIVIVATGDVTLQDPDGNNYPIAANVHFPINALSLRRHRLAFNGATGVTVSILQLIGLPGNP